mmetsp:Transcript_20265/g.29665  ORF Transcript_20265/g.29665 Transcript_20265/m.29665 type:complete len:112 (+) Transcript_20265:731-1066(+)
MVNCRDIVPRLPSFRYYHAGHLMWRRCDRLSEGEESNEHRSTAEAYYRQAGDGEQGLAGVPPSYIVRSYEPTMVSDHFSSAYLEWLEYGRIYGATNWTSRFQAMGNQTTKF